MPAIGILALQGDFEAHEKAFREAGASTVQVRHASGLDAVDALVIPGGESTTMLKLIEIENLWDALKAFGERKPIFATCAGAILVASRVTHPEQPSLALMDIDVERNACGRQVHSAVTKVKLDSREMEAVFIRAPIIRRAGPGVEVLATLNGDPVVVAQGRHLAATFHPELTQDRSLQRLFLAKI